jgi:DNA-binding NarL/FixJ family response regulator
MQSPSAAGQLDPIPLPDVEMDHDPSSSVNAETTHARLVLVDDNPAVLRQIIQVLPAEFEVVDAFEDGDELLAAVEREQPDLVVLDITLPGASGLVLASQLAKAGSSARIVFLTVHSDPDYVRAALRAGAMGFVVKTRLSLDLEPALRAALAGKRFISPIDELEALE